MHTPTETNDRATSETKEVPKAAKHPEEIWDRETERGVLVFPVRQRRPRQGDVPARARRRPSRRKRRARDGRAPRSRNPSGIKTRVDIRPPKPAKKARCTKKRSDRFELSLANLDLDRTIRRAQADDDMPAQEIRSDCVLMMRAVADEVDAEPAPSPDEDQTVFRMPAVVAASRPPRKEAPRGPPPPPPPREEQQPQPPREKKARPDDVLFDNPSPSFEDFEPEGDRRFSFQLPRQTVPILYALVALSILVLWSIWDAAASEDKTPKTKTSSTAQSRDRFPTFEVERSRRVTEAELERLVAATKTTPSAVDAHDASPELAQPVAKGERAPIRAIPGALVAEGDAAAPAERHSRMFREVTLPKPQVVDESRFFLPGGTLAVANADPGSKVGASGRALPPGLRIAAELEALVQSAAPTERVIARVTKTVKMDDEVLIAKGTRLFGRASFRADRLFIRFDKRVHDEKETDLSAYAREGNVPGIAARQVDGSSPGPNLLRGPVADSTGLLSGLFGGPSGAFVDVLSKRVLDQTMPDDPRDRREFEVPQGTTFEVVTL